jgi:MFS family permease
MRYAVLTTALPNALQVMGISQPDVALHMSKFAAIFSISTCVAAPSWGLISDAVGRRSIILICSTLAIAGLLMLAVADHVASIARAMILLGAGCGNAGVLRYMPLNYTKMI